MRESVYNIWVERGEAAYVFNGISGCLLRISQQDRRFLEDFLVSGETSSVSPKVLAHLAEGMMIVPDDADEIGRLSNRYQASRSNASHFALTVVTSLGCNFDCPYCFEDKHPSIMSEEVQEVVLQVLDDQLPKISSFRVTWYGGEPLLGKQAILNLSHQFIDRCERANVDFYADIVTNGYLLDKDTCAQLRECRVTSAQVTLDGPPQHHDRMRPLVSGQGSFWRVVGNLHHAIDYLDVSIRVNLDKENFKEVEELFKILSAEGFAGKLFVYPAQLVAINDGAPAPSATYKGCCFRNPEFARAELEFKILAARYGLFRPSLPTPVGAPCTAVRANELVVGSTGELYKCWDSVGNRLQVVGDIRDYQNTNGRLHKWLKYDPFANDECRSCIALPFCMGGCAHHAMDPMQYENRCGTFRYTYHEQVLAFVNAAELNGFPGLVRSEKLRPLMETR